MKRSLLLVCVVIFCMDRVKANPSNGDRLELDLTPIGAIRSANSDGSIPAWNADKLTEKAHLEWMQKIEKEQPLYTIDAGHSDQYAPLLSAGLQKMFQQYPKTFFMPVYPTHRPARQPQWTYEATRKNVIDARLSPSGDELLAAWPGTPFPLPSSAMEIMWNHQTRWKGLFIRLHLFENTVYDGGTIDTLETSIETYASYYREDRAFASLDWRSTLYFSYILGPARLAGGGLLIHDTLQPLHKPRQAWIYVAGERRMRRSPVLGYDSPLFNSEGIRVADEIDMFNGALDRYDWTLLGRREMLIPYNNQKMRYNRCDDGLVLTPHHLSSHSMRFEKHRVWVVEAKLKPGQRHIYAHRTFYIDEDTWSIVMADNYDKKGDLWRFALRFSAYYEDMPGMFSSLDAYHDFGQRAYFMQCSAGNGTEFYLQPPQDGYFSPTSIRQRLRR